MYMAVDRTPDVTDTQALGARATSQCTATRKWHERRKKIKHLPQIKRADVAWGRKKMGDLEAQNYTPMHSMQPNSELWCKRRNL